MSARYVSVQWNTHKKVYDLVLWTLIGAFIASYVVASKVAHTGEHAISDEILILRALALCAFTLLTLILCIGPLARLDTRFNILLYNRRHLGVSMALLALAHAALATLYYGGFGERNPISAVLATNTTFNSISAFPFELPGLLALLILLAMAATSHDFWLKNLSPRWWKSLHMLVYVAYFLLLTHIALGALQSESSPLYPALLLATAALVTLLHIASALVGARHESRQRRDAADWIDVAAPDEIPMNRARPVRCGSAPPIAVFRYEDEQGEAISAIHAVCAHQGGPLHEGRVIDGCATCPWHGYQYLPSKGQSPPPFTEKLPTSRVRLTNGRVQVDPRPLPPGAPTEPVRPGGPPHA
ncbi:MAG: ferric reductase-like transmembrane domain-containing protein [Phycisphaerales bacterium JB059]